jgi:trehalose 6-phosphate synthase/phosphatase
MRLIIISNRLPFSLDTNGSETRIRQSSGGLVSALKGYFEQNDEKGASFEEKIWVGSCDFSEEDWNANKENLQGVDFKIEPIFIDKDLYADYYNGFSNSTIWPLFHYFPSMTEYKKPSFEAYYEVNQLFANRVAEIMRPDDVIWVHDYQLMILPQMVRKVYLRLQLVFSFTFHFQLMKYSGLFPPPGNASSFRECWVLTSLVFTPMIMRNILSIRLK